MVIRYQFLTSYELLIQKYSGEWNMKEYQDYYHHIMQLPEFNKLGKVFSDMTQIDLTKTYKEMQELINFRVEFIKIDYFNVDFINNSMNTAFVHLYQNQLRDKGYDCEYCSTIDRALILLGLPFTTAEFEIIIDDLEHAYNFPKRAN